MAKDFIINTSGLNSYGTRVLTPGIDLTQYKRNPVLLYMHTRGFDGKSTPIGRVENIRVEGDELRGTPVFDMKDPFAAEIARKWEEDFIRMCSAGLEPVELSTATEYLLPGQSRATVVRSKLVEVSIADIGSNDDALQLYEPSGKILRLASGADSEIVPLLKNAHSPAAEPAPEENNPFFDEQNPTDPRVARNGYRGRRGKRDHQVAGRRRPYRDARTLPHRGGGRCCYRGKKDDRRQARPPYHAG